MRAMIFITVQKTLDDLISITGRLNDTQYTTKCTNLSGASIGQHLRHIIELLQCLLNGYDNAFVNYDLRKRDRNIETDRALAQQLLGLLAEDVCKPDRKMQLQVCFSDEGNHENIATTYFREIAYNIEHAIHHMALIRVGINEMAAIELPEAFGVAPSTLKYKALCAQ